MGSNFAASGFSAELPELEEPEPEPQPPSLLPTLGDAERESVREVGEGLRVD